MRATLESYIARNLSLRPSSADQLRYTVNALEKFAGSSVAVSQLTEDLLCKWLRTRPSTATAHRDRRNILTLLRFAKKRGAIADLPDIPAIRLPKTNPRAWTLEELGFLLAAAHRREGYMRDLPIRQSWWYQALTLFVYETSWRISSVLTTRCEDLYLDRQCVLVRSDGDKTHTDQVTRISQQLCDLLARGGIKDRELVFPYPWAKRKLWLDLRDLLRSASLPEGRSCGFHRLRKTHATQAVILSGWDRAQRDLGHASQQMTRRYVDMTQVVSAFSGPPLPIPPIG